MNLGSAWTDEKTERLIGNLLRAGVLASALIVLFGGALYLAQSGGNRADYRTFRGETSQLSTVASIVHAALRLESGAIIQIGLLVLILTPIARVVLSAYAFAREGDRVYVVITLIVLAVLMYSLLGTT